MQNGRKRDMARRLLSGVFLTAGLVCLASLAAIVVKGGRWTLDLGPMHVSAGKPGKLALLAALALLLSNLFRHGLRRPAREWMTLAGRIALLATSLTLSAVIAEQALRVVLRKGESVGSLSDLAAFPTGHPTRRVESSHPLAAITRVSANARLGYELRPNLDTDFGNRRLKTSSMGIRASSEYPAPKPAGTVRLIGIGDSGMFGWSTHQGEDYLAILEQRLAARPGSRIYEVLNMAVPGYSTFQEVEMLRTRGLAFQPDIVIVGWCPNDHEVPFFLHKTRDYRERDVSYLRMLLFDRAGFRRLTAPVVMKAAEVDRQFVDPVVLEYSGWDGVRKSLRDLLAMAERHGFKVFVYGPAQQEAVAVFDELGLAYFNTLTLDPALYPGANVHGIHPRAPACLIHAERIEQELDRLGWLPRNQPL